MNIEDALKKLNLSEKETQIYLALFRLGTSAASRVAREVHLPRQTVYTIIQELMARELIVQSDRRGVKQFAADPSALFAWINKQKQLLEEQQRTLETELPKLLEKKKRGPQTIGVQYYEGREGLKRLFNNTLDQYRLGKTKEFRGYGINKFQETALADYLYEWVKKRHAYNIDTKLLIGKGPDDFDIIDTETVYGRKIKRLNMEPQKAGVYLIGDRLYLFSFADNVGIMIENQSIVELLRKSFDDHWNRVQ